MVNVIGVRFQNAGKLYFFDPGAFWPTPGDFVIVETARGIEFGEVVTPVREINDEQLTSPLKQVVRIATAQDVQHAQENKQNEKEAYAICQKKISEHKLDMKLVSVEYTFDNSKILFYFTANGRVDFRSLVKDLAAVFKTRIELRQIGVRDEARMLGGIGICGKPFCCAQFLEDFQPVSIKMAKVQGISMNPAKISGSCGRLMCCLKYEQDAYEELVRSVPKVDSFVETPIGKGMVLDVNILKGTVRVKLEDQTEIVIRTFNADEVEVLGGKGKRAEYLAARARGEIEAPKPIARLKKPEPVIEEPEPVPAEEEHAEEKKQANKPKKNNRRRRPSQKKPQGEVKSEKPAPRQEQQPQQAAKKPNNRHRRHRRGGGNRRPGGEAPKQGE